MYRACILIPVYNHHRFIAKTLERLSVYGLDVIMVDDGSNEECQQVLRALAGHNSAITLFRLEPNQGKGAAVMRGMAEAYARGYTHALQVDADGQHAIDDIGRFIELSQAHPDEVISGRPIYDDSIPKGRLYGRYITHFWVWVETLSFSIKDSMCGFRVYPLAACCVLIERCTLGTRMDFDTEILVRLYWRGVKTRFIDTKVIYPEDGISHFKMVRDNCRISYMHTRLCLGMLMRLPLLLARKCKNNI